MQTPSLLHDLVFAAARRDPAACALRYRAQVLTYGDLAAEVSVFAAALTSLEWESGARVAIYLEQRTEAVIAAFGTSAAAGVHVPVNPILKSGQVAHILSDCGVRILVTTRDRLTQLAAIIPHCTALRHVILVDGPTPPSPTPSCTFLEWATLSRTRSPATTNPVDPAALALIFYTSGSTGMPKGVMVSHRNLLCGAQSVAGYLENNPRDVVLAALPLSFDAGFSQLTTAFWAGASVVLLNYLLPRDLLNAMCAQQVTGITAVPPLYHQLAQVDWPEAIKGSLRYFASTGGRMPKETLNAIRARVPAALPYLMYGLTEAFRSTYLPPEEIDRHPDSIGRAIPGAEVLVLRPDGSLCDADEPGELVHRGPLVTLGYWNDPVRTGERFRPLPAAVGGLPNSGAPPEIVVFSGDTVRRDAEGFLYFVARSDEMIKSSGYRISPTEIEESIYATGLVGECAAFGVPDPALGQAICVAATPMANRQADSAGLLAACRLRMPRYMMPIQLDWWEHALPRNPNGKIDRQALRERLVASSPAMKAGTRVFT